MSIRDGDRVYHFPSTGIVVKNDVGNGRVKVRVPSVYGDDVADDDLPDARPCYQQAGNYRGDLPVPNVGISVLVIFEGGDPSQPFWVGSCLVDSDERAANKRETVSGTKETRIAEDDVRDVMGDQTTAVKGKMARTARKRLEEYQDQETIVLGERRYTYGRRIGEIQGKDELKVQGSQLLEVLGSQTIRATEAIRSKCGADETRFALGTQHTIGTNSTLTSLPMLGTAWSGDALNGFAKLTAAPITGLPYGSQLSLDPSGLLTTLMSLLNIFIQANTLISLAAPLVTLGMLPALPVANMAHVHLGNMGVPTGPAIPNPTGTGLSMTVLVPPL